MSSLYTPHNRKCLSVGTPKKIDFPFVPNGKFMILGVPILKNFRVNTCTVLTRAVTCQHSLPDLTLAHHKDKGLSMTFMDIMVGDADTK